MRTRRSQSSSDPTLPGNVEGHIPVLLHETISSLEIVPDDIVVDGTLGGAGHARALTDLLDTDGVFIGLDLDADAIGRARGALAGARPTVHLVQANFRNVASELGMLGVSHVTKAVFDLGWSQFQLTAGRGFSFLRDEPLSMMYSKEPGALTASVIVNSWAEESIADVIYGWGEERFARRIARAIVATREKRPITTSIELAEIVRAAVPGIARRGRIHPATKTFQALRIATNDELGAITAGLKGTWSRLAPGGRIAVITFHSIEDRLVKRQFVEWQEQGLATRLTKKPVTPSLEELSDNPRSRSAKLRVIQKNIT